MVMCLGATNQPWELDDAFKRRFEKRIFIPLPGPDERKALLRLCLRDIRLAEGVDTDLLAAERLANYSGADIAVVCKHAAYAPMRHKQAEVARRFPRADQMRERVLAIQAAEQEIMSAGVTQADFEDAIAACKPSASGGNRQMFEAYAREHGSAHAGTLGRRHWARAQLRPPVRTRNAPSQSRCARAAWSRPSRGTPRAPPAPPQLAPRPSLERERRWQRAAPPPRQPAALALMPPPTPTPRSSAAIWRWCASGGIG
jgi:hypothetical protein